MDSLITVDLEGILVAQDAPRDQCVGQSRVAVKTWCRVEGPYSKTKVLSIVRPHQDDMRCLVWRDGPRWIDHLCSTGVAIIDVGRPAAKSIIETFRRS